MRIDRVAEDIFVFISDLYVQVTSTLLLTDQGAILIDALPFPSEAREVQAFVGERLGPDGVRYLILTHHHADHVYGAYVFEGAEIISHDLCRQLLARLGPSSLEQAKKSTPALAEVELRLPDMTFQSEMRIHLGHRDLHLFHTPGHTPDGISVYVEGEKVIVAGDLMMPVPYIVHGDIAEMKRSMQRFVELRPDFIVQGHGNVLLRGEVRETVDSYTHYLDQIVQRVEELVARGEPPSRLREIDIESCGLSRIPLDGAVSQLHLQNLISLYRRKSKRSATSLA